MPSPIIANVAQVTVKGSLFGQVVENVWYAQCSASPTAEELTGIAEPFPTFYAELMLGLSEDLSINEIVVRNMGSAAGPEITFAVTPAQTGGVATASMPGNVAFCISLRSALAGRQFRGRKYFSGLPINQVVDNAINVTLADQMVTAVQGLIAQMIINTNPLQAVSLTYLTSVPLVTAVYTDLWVDSQRRRLTGRGA
jgi:hypothetical protein